jgi:5-methylcytosine-specific restriction endonuclease McrA
MTKYRATATVVWDFDSELPQEQALEHAKAQIEGLPPQQGMADLRTAVRLDKLKEKVQKVKLGEFEIADVMPYITKDDSKREYEYDGVKHAVKMNSHRYFLFRECMKCVACGLKGTKMLLEHHPADKSPHFNLYGVEDGKLILLTKDHIHAKSCGGEDRHSNYQTMCIVCNNLKGHANLTLDAIAELRTLYNENKASTTKKKLHLLIEEAKTRLSKPWPKPNQRKKVKASADAVFTACDLNIWKIGSELVGRPVYDLADSSHKHVGCIKKGVCLEPLISIGNKIMCKLEEEVVTFNQGYVVPRKQ